jgi:pimeloyl-ACP methyl ester carboxylesterase
MAATIPMAQLVTIGGGHMIHDSRPDEFAAAVLDHFAAAQRT